MRFEPESYVSPHVRLVQLLRMGAVGSIWTAYHDVLGREVAVKFMSASLTEDQATVTRFNREGTFTAKINSAHVVEVHEQGLTDDGLPYMVMELLRGEDLSERMARTGPLPLEETRLLVAQLCDALGAAHEVGIIHRDVRPNNVFVVDNGGPLFVKLLDFGVAKGKSAGHDSSAVTGAGAIIGSIMYMSPEQFFNAKSVDGRADLWSVAVVAYRALTGQSPFTTTGLEALLTAVRSGVFPPPSERRGTIPASVDDWFKRALRRNPDDRFQTAGEMASALEAAMRREELGNPLMSLGEVAGGAKAPSESPAKAPSESPAAPCEAGGPRVLAARGDRSRGLRWARIGVGVALLLGAAAAYVRLSEPAVRGGAPAAPAEKAGAPRDGAR